MHKPRLYIENQGLKSHSLSELIWMTHTEDDEKVIPDMLKSVEPFADKLSKLTSMVSNTNPNTKINNENLINLLNEVASDFKDINFLESLGQKLNVMTSEIKEILNLININDYENLKAF